MGNKQIPKWLAVVKTPRLGKQRASFVVVKLDKPRKSVEDDILVLYNKVPPSDTTLFFTLGSVNRLAYNAVLGYNPAQLYQSKKDKASYLATAPMTIPAAWAHRANYIFRVECGEVEDSIVVDKPAGMLWQDGDVEHGRFRIRKKKKKKDPNQIGPEPSLDMWDLI